MAACLKAGMPGFDGALEDDAQTQSPRRAARVLSI
jgi:hypothetical protein